MSMARHFPCFGLAPLSLRPSYAGNDFYEGMG
jgi:hypothetical protein